MKILAIETSCDETSAAVSLNGSTILSNIVASSSDLFRETGGVVPEVAARKQLEYIIPITDKALDKAGTKIEDIDYFAVTVGPGLIGSLFVGVDFVKTLSLIYKKPIIPVNHLIGHIYSAFITNYLGTSIQTNASLPALVLVVSGGHTDLVYIEDYNKINYLGGTRDDAAGESFDKVARILGLSKYLGGVPLSKKASTFKGNTELSLPMPLANSNDFDFSFSGLKTATMNVVNSYPAEEVAFAFEEAVVNTLLTKSKKAYSKYKPSSFIVCGGVSANTKLRDKFKDTFGDKVVFPLLDLCTDNAAMIACAASSSTNAATTDLSKISANPSLSLEVLE